MEAQKKAGTVYLVGAGPADPGLITVRGAKLLDQADVVVFDYLSNPRLLGYCPRAEKIYVGKKGPQHALPQAEINQLLVDLARRGKNVVRLKGGDPFVFGRGGEECEVLARAGIDFEVVPGITSAIAAAAYAGIPVTHRDFNSSFTLVTGHEKEEEYRDEQAKARSKAHGSSDIDWSAIARLPCVAFYMGVKALPRICEKLVENGMRVDTPAATIQWGTSPRQKVAVGTIGDLPQKVQQAGVGSPAITIVGEVVKLRETINWFERRPLFGETIVVTRTRQQASELTQQLEALGAEVLEAPTIELRPPASWDAADAVLRELSSFDWIVFTSANGVSYAKERLLQIGLDARAFGNAKIAAIGEATRDAVTRELALRVDLCPASFVAEALADELIAQGAAGRRFLLLRADIARPILRERLQQAGAAEVKDVVIYETHPAAGLPSYLLDAIDTKRVTWITFTSSSTARNFVTLLGDDYLSKLKGVKLASIGPITSKTIREHGLEPTVEAATFNIGGLVEAIRAAKG